MAEMLDRAAEALFLNCASRMRHVRVASFAMQDEADKQIWREQVAAVMISMLQVPADVLEAGCASHPPGDYHANTTLASIILAEWQAMIRKGLGT